MAQHSGEVAMKRICAEAIWLGARVHLKLFEPLNPSAILERVR